MADKNPRVEKRGVVTCILLGPEFETLDEQRLDTIRQQLLDAAAAANPARVVIDLQFTAFFGSSFIEVLFRIWNRINATPGGKFAIAGLSPYCEEVLEVTHLDRLWKLFPSVDEAVADVGS